MHEQTVTIAITGATGFVGQAVVPLLLSENNNLRILTRTKNHLWTNDRVTFIRGDLGDLVSLEDLVNGCSVVLHLAGAISAKSREDFFDINVSGTANLVAACQKRAIKRFVHVSSIAAREPHLSDYAASKCEAERLVADMPSAIVLRPCAVYGGGDLATLPLFKNLLAKIAAVPSRRDNRFSLIHVSDLARICCDALTTSTTGIHELGDAGNSWRDLATVMRRHYGRPRTLWYIPRSLASTVAWFAEKTQTHPILSRGKVAELYHHDWVIRQSSEYPCTTRSLEQGLIETVEWYMARGLLPRLAHVKQDS